MTRVWTITVVVAVAVAVSASPAATSPDDLLNRAEVARREAEKELADARRQRLEQRKAVAAGLQREYDALAKAKADAEGAQQSLRRIETTAADLERTAPATDRRIRNVVRQAAEAAGVTVDPSGTVEAMETAIWKGFQTRLAEIGRHAQVTVEAAAVISRTGAACEVPVARLGGFASYACGGTPETCGLLRRTADGRWLVAGPLLSGEGAAALDAVAAGNLERVPLDIDGTLADRAPSAPKTVWAWLDAGGMFIYPILAVGALGLILVLERVVYLVFTKMPPSLVQEVLPCLERRDVDGAREVLLRSRTPAGRVLLAGVEAVGKSHEEREAAMETALLAEAPKLERSLSLLGALAGVAPLLGLLGTVSGMIATFDTISAAGTGNPRLLSGGISEALLTTQLGLMVAIPLLLAHAWLRRWVERREAMLEHHAVQAFGIGERDEDTPA